MASAPLRPPAGTPPDTERVRDELVNERLAQAFEAAGWKLDDQAKHRLQATVSSARVRRVAPSADTER